MPSFTSRIAAQHLTILLLAIMSFPLSAAVDRDKAQVFYESALEHFSSQRLPESVIELRNALQQDPKNLPARILLGRTLLRQDQASAAIVELEKALSLGGDENLILPTLALAYLENLEPARVLTGIVPGNHRPEIDAELHLLQARAYLQLGHKKAAEQSYLEASQLLPGDPRPLLGRANLALSKKQRGQADTLISQALEIAPDDFDVWIFKALMNRDFKEYGPALEAFEKALQIRPTSGRALTARAAMWMDLDQIPKAKEDLAKAADLDVSTLETYYLRTLILFNEGKADEARQVLRDGADIIRGITEEARDKLPHTKLMLGIVAYFDQNYVEAIDHLERFLTKAPRHNGAKRYLASAYMAVEEWDSVIKLFKTGLSSVLPNNPLVLTYLAEAYRAKGNYTLAERHYDAAIKLAPNSVGIAISLAMSRFDAGKTMAAIEDLKWLGETYPDLLEPPIQLANLYAQTSQMDKAIETITLLLQEHPDNPLVLTTAGGVYTFAGDFDTAREYTNKALTIVPNASLPQFNLARIAQQEGHLASAATMYRQLLETYPNLQRALLEFAELSLRQGEFEEAEQRIAQALDNDSTSKDVNVLAFKIALASANVDTDPQDLRLKADEMLVKFSDASEVNLLVGQYNQRTDDEKEAKRLYRHAADNARFNTATLMEIANSQLSMSDLNGALWSATKAVQGSPADPSASALKATILIDTGDLQTAGEILDEFEQSHPDDVKIISARGHWLMAQGQGKQAIEKFKMAHAQSQTIATLNTLFRGHVTLGNPLAAIELLKLWIKDNPDDMVTKFKLAEAYIFTRNYKQARLSYESLLGENPESILVLNNLASIYQRLGDERALETARRAYEKAPDTPSVLDTYGWILTETGNPEQGLPLLREAFARQSTGAELRYHIGLALMKLGREEDAADEFEAAIDSEQWFYDIDKAKSLLAEVRQRLSGR